MRASGMGLTGPFQLPPAAAREPSTSESALSLNLHPHLHCGHGRDAYARLMYAPSLVSTRIFSPSLMKGGTWTTRPVSVLAGLVTELAVADFIPGSVSTTVISTTVGSSMPTALPSWKLTEMSRLGVRYSTASPRVSCLRWVCS